MRAGVFIKCFSALFAMFVIHVNAASANLIEELKRVVPIHPQVIAAASQVDALKSEIEVALAPSNIRGGLEGGPSISQNVSGGGATKDANLAAKVIVPLLDGGRVNADTDRAKQKVMAQEARLLATKQDVAIRVAGAYVEVVKRQALLNDAIDHLKQLNEISARMQRIMAVDPGRSSDYSQALSRAAQQEQTIAQRKSELADAQGSYISLTSVSLLNPAEPLDYQVTKVSREMMQQWAAKSPATIAALADVSAEQASLKYARAWERPTIALVGRLDSRRDTNNKVRYFDAATVGLSVSWDRFDGGAGAAAAVAAENRVKASISTLDSIKRDTMGQIMRVVTITQGLEGRPAAAVKAQVCANQVRIAYRKQFEVARRPLIDLLNAENDWFVQRSGALAAHYESITANLRVAAVAGDLWPLNEAMLKQTIGLDESIAKDAPCLNIVGS